MHTDNELTEIIACGESDCVEFTESTQDLDKIRKAICAFSNDLPNHRQPGLFFIGIRDDGSCAGLKITDKLLQVLGGLRSDGKIQPLPSIEVGKRILNDCEVAVIQVEPSDNPPVKFDGRCWIRVGPRRERASAEEERRLTEKRRWGNLSYDMHRVNGSSVENDLDLRRFKDEYLPFAVPPEVLEENDRNHKEQLQALRLTTQDGAPTVTAILMLGKEPFYWFPGAYIQFVRYEGNAVTDPIKYQTEIHGTLPDQLRELDKILQVHISVALDTSGGTHTKKPDYPFEALREISRNAVIHRSYENSNTNTPVKVYWFTDRVEIISPGTVYGAVTRKNFGNPNVVSYRNPTIAEAMKNMGFMQRFGIGINTARKALQNNGNPLPKFDAQDTLVLATIKK